MSSTIISSRRWPQSGAPNQTEAIVEPLQVDPRTIGPDSFDRVSQRMQLEQIDKVLRQVTTGKDQERKMHDFLAPPPAGAYGQRNRIHSRNRVDHRGGGKHAFASVEHDSRVTFWEQIPTEK